MKAIEFPEQNTVFAKDQPEYLPLPAFVDPGPTGQVITCYEFTDEEIQVITRTKKIYLSQLAFHGQLQPQRPSVESPFEEVVG